MVAIINCDYQIHCFPLPFRLIATMVLFFETLMKTTGSCENLVPPNNVSGVVSSGYTSPNL